MHIQSHLRAKNAQKPAPKSKAGTSALIKVKMESNLENIKIFFELKLFINPLGFYFLFLFYDSNRNYKSTKI